MHPYTIRETQLIPAPAPQIYAMIADYEVGHPSILPAQYFKKLTVTHGGQGVGTEFDLEMEVMGNRTHGHFVVTEARPHAFLAEEEPTQGIRTTFELKPQPDGQTAVTIESHFRGRPGLRGWLEKLMTPRLLRKIYREELDQLTEVLSRVPHP